MNCLPNPSEESNEVSFDIQRDIGRILEKVGETAASGVQTNQIEADQRLSPAAGAPQSDSYVAPQAEEPQETVEQFVQVGEQVVPVTSAGYYYPVASGVPACFTGDAVVMTPSGEKAMRDVRVGDMVMTNEYGKMTYARVTSWLHRLPEVKAAFIKLTTEQGAVVSMTPQHFIYKADCITEKMELVYAEDVQEGDCLMVKEADELVMTTVTAKSAFYETGVYAPMTETGDLIVDNVYASCHNVIKTNTLTHTFLNVASSMQQKIRSLFGSLDETGHLPATSEFFLNIVDVLLPHKY